ncbi:hypothetical protein Phum_PHUM222910 [Pediculus humanus corporis]|uniref:Uncharacterized protein n=1 Tax=Pediculus humanus subsp. corporis TaxID=121224 RepID=E0VIB4_PEDHC|nr:uncharacterized protein Phum_PHUM222910 [Pediculus humanus corporis]EEB13120.1 hypothetical protein Phum_PHUM222910 [Pediculus humanus corporis]
MNLLLKSICFALLFALVFDFASAGFLDYRLAVGSGGYSGTTRRPLYIGRC